MLRYHCHYCPTVQNCIPGEPLLFLNMSTVQSLARYSQNIKICLSLLFGSHKFPKTGKKYLKMYTNKFSQLTKNLSIFYPNKLLLIRNMGLGSGIRGPRLWIRKKTQSGSQSQKSTGSRIPIRNTASPPIPTLPSPLQSWQSLARYTQAI